jgi:ABC-type amino acid transport substrate-binding protein
VARKVISKECEESINRVLAAVDSMPEEFDSIRPEIVRQLLNDGGSKNFNLGTVIAAAHNNALLLSTGMFMANIASAMSQGLLYVPRSMIRNGAVNTYAAYAAVLGKDAQLTTNMLRYFKSAMKTGIASDVETDIRIVARRAGLTEEKLKEKAKEAYVRSWAATDDSITEADIDAFVDSINLTDQEALRFFSDIEFMANQRVPDKLKWITLPQRGAVAIDEAAKVFFRTLKVSEMARKQALQQSKATGRPVNELHAEYFADVMNAHNARYQGEIDLAKEIETTSNFKAVRGATAALEKRSNEFFKPLFSAEDIPYEDIREFALNLTFQRRLPTETLSPVTGAVNLLGRAKGRMGAEYSVGENVIGALTSVAFPFTKTPYNIVMDGMSYTPLALIPFFRPKILKKKMREGKTVTEVGYEEDWLTKVAVGSAFMMSIGTLFATQNEDGLPFITGTPKDLEERRRWQQAGIPERSVLVGDVYVPFDRIEPIGTFLGLYVDLAEAVFRERDFEDPEETPLVDTADELIGALLNASLNKTVLESGIRFLDNFRYSNKSLVEGAIASGVDIGKGFIPTGVSDLARILDEEERIAKTGYEKVIQRVPGLRETLPVATPQFEGVDMNQNLFEIITKMNFVPTNQSQVQKEIYRKEANIPVIDSEFVGVKLDGRELSLLRELAAPYQNAMLSALVESGEYKLAGNQFGASRQKVLIEDYASRSVHPGRNKQLLAKFIQEGTKRFGPNWVRSIQARKFNEKIRQKGLQDAQQFMDTVY